MHRSALFIAALAGSLVTAHDHVLAQGVSCEELQVRIEAKIRANGAENFAVEVVQAASQAQGQVVGTCERGEKKLVYIKGKAGSPVPSSPRQAPAASAASAAKTKTPPVITECADGRVITSGNCKST